MKTFLLPIAVLAVAGCATLSPDSSSREMKIAFDITEGNPQVLLKKLDTIIWLDARGHRGESHHGRAVTAGRSGPRAVEVVLNVQLRRRRCEREPLIVTGKLGLELRPVDSAAVVEAAIEAIQALADERDIELKVVVDPLAGAVLGDPSRLQQVVWNLLSNSIKFTPQHGRVELRHERVNAMVRISVRDTGRGIRPDLLPHIFEPFRQAEDARRVGGLGLGLAIVHQIVEQHHGTVRAESAGEGLGASFVVELPLMKEQVDAVEAAPLLRGTEHRASSGLTGVNVLVVDDEADVRELLTTILRLAGAETTAVASAADALVMLQQRRVDVLVSDLGMPGDDGYALIRKVRELHPQQGGTIPAIAVTAAARAEDRVRALSAGFHLHIVKPIDPAELTAAIAQVSPPVRQRSS